MLTVVVLVILIFALILVRLVEADERAGYCPLPLRMPTFVFGEEEDEEDEEANEEGARARRVGSRELGLVTVLTGRRVLVKSFLR